MLRRVLTVVTIAALTLSSSSEARADFTWECGHADVSCRGLMNDLVTQKFTARFAHDRYAIQVYAETTRFDQGDGVTMAIVGVVPRARGTHAHMPNRIWRVVTYHARVGDAYERQQKSRNAIRRAVENMMASCDDSPSCDILD